MTASALIPKFVAFRTAIQDPRLGAWSVVMPSHHKGRATTSEGLVWPPRRSLFPASGGRRRPLVVGWHHLRAASYPEAGRSDPKCHELRNQDTRGFSISWRQRAAACCAVLVLFAPITVSAQKGQPAGVGVDAVLSQPLEQTVPVIGRLVARQSGVVAARTRGPVAELRVEVGDRVQEGQVLAVLVIDRPRIERQLRAAEVAEEVAAVKTANAQIELLSQEMKRLEGLRRSAAFSQARYEDKRQEVVKAQSAAAEAEAALASARANFRMAEIELRDTKILAPYAGVVAVRHTEVGSYLNVGNSVITLVDNRNLEIEADVPSERIGGLEPGAEVTCRMNGSYSVPAMVRALLPEENPLTRTRTVRFTPHFDGNERDLATNQTVTILVPAGPARRVVTVHKDAVLNRKGNSVVFVVNDGQAHLRKVLLGEPVGSRFEVLAGLAAGDLAVVRGNERLRPEQKVSIKGKP